MTRVTPPRIAQVAFVVLFGATLFAPAVFAERREPQVPVRYPLGPDSLVQADVPKGRLEGPFEFRSKIIAPTVRLYWVYVPAQYDPATPANLLVFQDGNRATNPNGVIRVQNVLENLAAKKQIPPTIGIFITPGQRGDVYPDTIGTSNPDNRDREYDVLDDNYARMLIEEIMPEVGKKYRFTDDPARRAIGGSSSGAICAFTVAWHYPNEFRNVISFIGSFTNIHGGHVYPQMIRESEKKDIRVFLQDGINDNRSPQNPERDWYLQNKLMAEAFEAKEYDYAYVLGEGPHADDHGGAMLPYMLRWVWRDLPGVNAGEAEELVAAAKAVKPERVDAFRGFDANAKVDAAGMWTWSQRRRGGEVTSTLTIRSEGGKLAGTLQLPPGFGEDQAPPPAEVVVELEGNKLYVDGPTRTVTRGDNTFTTTTSYQGIIEGDRVVGWELRDFNGSPRDGRWEARRSN